MRRFGSINGSINLRSTSVVDNNIERLEMMSGTGLWFAADRHRFLLHICACATLLAHSQLRSPLPQETALLPGGLWVRQAAASVHNPKLAVIDLKCENPTKEYTSMRYDDIKYLET